MGMLEWTPQKVPLLAASRERSLKGSALSVARRLWRVNGQVAVLMAMIVASVRALDIEAMFRRFCSVDQSAPNLQ